MTALRRTEQWVSKRSTEIAAKMDSTAAERLLSSRSRTAEIRGVAEIRQVVDEFHACEQTVAGARCSASSAGEARSSAGESRSSAAKAARHDALYADAARSRERKKAVAIQKAFEAAVALQSPFRLD